jgi:predicted lysophospholipase L1 biosynthesis ABC-type transport system permease subunit
VEEDTIRISDLRELHLGQWQRWWPQILHVCLQDGEAQALLLTLGDMFRFTVRV